VKLLLEKGADAESKDSNGRTPMGWAGEPGREAVVKLLLEKGAAWTPRTYPARGRCGREGAEKLLL